MTQFTFEAVIVFVHLWKISNAYYKNMEDPNKFKKNFNISPHKLKLCQDAESNKQCRNRIDILFPE